MNNILTFLHKRKYGIFAFVAVMIAAALYAGATGSEVAGEEAEAGHASMYIASTFLWIAIVLIFAKLSALVEKIGQPSVLGELVIGVILGNLALLGLHWFEPIKTNEIIEFLSELGVVILLFQIGLESNIKEMKKVGMASLLVAIIGVIVPFILGTYVVGPWLLPGLSMNAYLFLGAAMTATSVGITGRVFKDLKKLHLPEAKIVLGAAVIDDILGLIILAVVSALVTVGAVSVGAISLIIGKAVLFLIAAIVIGQLAAPWLGKFFSKIHTGVGTKFTLAIAFCLIFSYVAQLIGLAAIVGAFAAGLVLDAVHFRYFKDAKVIRDIKEVAKDARDEIKERLDAVIEPHAHRHIEDIIEPVAFLLVPIFFVYTGMQVNLGTLSDIRVVGVAIAITVVAIIGKYVAGFGAKGVNRSMIGFGMVPRGEVGLIFASIGKGLGVVSDEVFSVIVIMVILTTLLTPPILAFMLKKHKEPVVTV
ncbi:MAG: cation:proton antiporter [Patescibacteria group bacterium]